MAHKERCEDYNVVKEKISGPVVSTAAPILLTDDSGIATIAPLELAEACDVNCNGGGRRFGSSLFVAVMLAMLVAAFY